MKRLAAFFASVIACASLAQVPIYTRPAAIAGTAVITGGTITGTTIDNSVIGGTTPAAGSFNPLNVGAVGSQAILQGDAANILAQRNSTTGQALRVYNTFTDASNGEWYETRWTANTVFLVTNQNGAGAARNMFIGTVGAGTVLFGANNTTFWDLNTGGVFYPNADNSYDLGITATNRLRTGYFATSVISPAVNGIAGSAGGTIAIAGGAGSSTTGGNVTLTGGTATSGAGSAITITAGSGAGGTNAGGDVNLIPGAAVSTGTPGEVKINSARGFFEACWQQYLPASVPVSGTSYTFFMANRAYRVVAASIINSSTSTVPTVDVIKDTGTTAPGAGSTVLTGVMTFSATANTRVAGTIIGTVATTNLAAGDRLSTKWAGTVGAITGAIVCVTLVPI